MSERLSALIVVSSAVLVSLSFQYIQEAAAEGHVLRTMLLEAPVCRN